MNPVLYMLAGAAALAVAYGVYVGGRKVVETARALTAALGGIPRLIKAVADNSEALNKFSSELEFLRTAMLGASLNFGPENPEQPGAASTRKPLPAFPGAPPFIPVPDAAVDDTDVVDTTDAELVEQEKLEEIRGQGFEAEPLENPPGIVKNV